MTYAEVEIEQVCDTGSGGTPSRAKQDLYFGGTIPWVKSGELRESVITQTEESLTEAGLNESAAKLLPKDALLVALYGATVGRVGILGIEAATNQAVCHIIPDRSRLDHRYLFHALRSKVPYWLSQRVGGGQPNISQGVIKKTKIPLPSLSEQKRIAEILDRAEALRAKRRAALALLDELTQSIFLDMFGDAEVQVSKWPVHKIAEYVNEFQGGKSLESNDDKSSQYRVLKVSAVTGMKFRPEESKPIDDDYEPPEDHYVRNGDLLFSRANTTELVGAVAYVTNCPQNLLLPDKLWRFVWKDKKAVHPLFVWYLFQTRPVRREIGNRATGTSGSMKNISKEKLFGIPTILPPIELQQTFADRIIAIERMQDRLKESLSELNVLFATLQHQAFRGEL
ncbi:MAG: restriction endonuclease subunit S [Pirellula sp.]